MIPAVLAAIVLAVAACGGDEPEAATATTAPAATATTAPAPTAAQPTATTAPPAPSGPSGNVTIASTISPLIQNQRRDISAVGGIGRSLSVWETIVRAPFVAPPQPPPQDHTGYSPTDLGLASSWTIASDFTSITFDIRPDIPWHSNGGDWGNVTADDVAWSFNEAFAPDSVNNGAEEIGAEMKLGVRCPGSAAGQAEHHPRRFRSDLGVAARQRQLRRHRHHQQGGVRATGRRKVRRDADRDRQVPGPGVDRQREDRNRGRGRSLDRHSPLRQEHHCCRHAGRLDKRGRIARR